MASKTLKKADAFAEKAHSGQFDMGGHPYIEHPRYVASMVDGETAKIAALLHDTVEDTDVTLDDIRAEFGDEIAEIVGLLTHKKGTPYMEYIKAIAQNDTAKKVKIADLTHNMDTSRLLSFRDGDKKRIEKYQKALAFLAEK